MPELHRAPHPRRYPLEKVGKAGVVARLPGPQLEQHHAAAIGQLMPAGGDAIKPGLRRIEPLGVSQSAGRLDREEETLGQPPTPACECTWRRPPVETRVEFDRPKPPCVYRKSLRLRGTRRIEHVLPVLIAPSRSPDVHDHAVRLASFISAASGPGICDRVRTGSWQRRIHSAELPACSRRALSGGSASTKAVTPAVRVATSAQRCCSRSSDSTSPRGTATCTRSLCFTSERSRTASTRLAWVPGGMGPDSV